MTLPQTALNRLPRRIDRHRLFEVDLLHNPLILVIALLLARPAAAQTTISQDFDQDPFWSSFNSSVASDQYGFSHFTTHAGGNPGEAGGLFGRHDGFDSYYADTDIGGELLAGTHSLHSSGKIAIDGTHTGNGNNLSIAFFDYTNPSKGGNSLRVNVVEGGRFQLWLRLEIGKNLVSPLVSGLVDGEYTWAMDWDPTGSADGLGEGTVTFHGVSPGTPTSLSATLDIPVRTDGSPIQWLEETLPFNAFGLHNYDGEATTSGRFSVFVDDVTYSVAAPPATASTWIKPGSGLWTDSFHWSPGEVPFGADRTAIFAGGVWQHTTVYTHSDLVIQRIEFDNANFNYAVAGVSGTSLTLAASAGSASLAVASGDHQCQIPVVLGSDATANVSDGASLSFGRAVDLAGHDLLVTGAVEFHHQLILNGGTLTLSGGNGSISFLGQDPILDGSLKVVIDRPAHAGDVFDLLDFEILESTFDRVILPELPPPLHWNLSGLYVDGTIQVVPEPSGWLIVGLTLTTVLVLRSCGRTQHARFWLIGVAVLAVPISAASVSADLIGQHFNFDPNWQSDDSVLPQGNPATERDDFNNYRYRADTNNALGSPGEIGGYLGMNTFDSFYADTTLGGSLGGGFPLQQTLHASGKLMVNSDHGPTWNMNIGFFDQNDYTDEDPTIGEGNETGNGDAIRLAIIEQSPDFRMRLEIRQQGNGYNSPVLAGEDGLLDGQYVWSMDYNPHGGAAPGNGRLSILLIGPTTIWTFVDVDAAGKNIAMDLNAFGFTNYRSSVSRPDTNKHYAFLDDLTYTTAETADPVVQWACPGSGDWNAAFSWQRTNSGDGGGFVPNGSDRTAIFGGSITQHSLVFLDSDAVVRELRLDNATYAYSFAGIGSVRLDGGLEEDASLRVASGQHEFLTSLTLDDNANLTTDSGTTLTLHGPLDLNAYSLTKTGGGTLVVNNDIASSAGVLWISEGTVSGVGQIGGDVTVTGGRVSPGLGADELSLSGDYLQQSGGLLTIELGGHAPGISHDVLQVGGTATLVDFTQIEVVLIDEFMPTDGDTFDVLTASTVAVDTSLLGFSGAADFTAHVVTTGTGQVLRLIFGSSADFDFDGDVDGDDFLLWQTSFMNDDGGDADHDGDTDGDDFLIWQTEYGSGSGSASAAVPEPASILLLLAICVVGLLGHRSRRA